MVFLFTFKSYYLNVLPGSLPSISSLVLYLMEVTIFETAALLSLPSCSSFLCLFSTPPSAGSCVAFQSNHPFPKQVTALPTPQKLCQESSRSLLLHTAKLSSKPKPCCLLYDLPRETKRLCPRRSHNAISNS